MEPYNNQTIQNPPEGTRDCVKSSFIEANTIPSTLEEIKSKHIIPVFAKDSEPVISQADFIEATCDGLSKHYAGELINAPEIRVSHPIQGIVANARFKPVQYLDESEKTIYYDRLAFMIEIPTISGNVGGNPLSLTMGGVQAYNLTNLHSRKGADQHFKIFIGFKNTVCTNLKIWSDGLISGLKVTSVDELKANIKLLIENYNAPYHLRALEGLVNFNLSEKQFAQVLGKARMYHHLPLLARKYIPELLINDTQLSIVVREFYHDNNFKRDHDGSINLWKLYNLFTGATKSSYIDHFLDRSVNAFEFVEGLKRSLEHQTESWFLN